MTNKYNEQVSIVNGEVWVGSMVTIDSFDDIDELAAELKRVLKQRNGQRVQERQKKLQDPATYGLDSNFAVRIGSGTELWRLDRIRPAGWDRKYAVGADITRWSAEKGYQHKTVDVERLVQTVTRISEML